MSNKTTALFLPFIIAVFLINGCEKPEMDSSELSIIEPSLADFDTVKSDDSIKYYLYATGDREIERTVVLIDNKVIIDTNELILQFDTIMNAGNYLFSFKVVDTEGLFSQESRNLVVIPVVRPKISFIDSSVCIYGDTVFSNIQDELKFNVKISKGDRVLDSMYVYKDSLSNKIASYKLNETQADSMIVSVELSDTIASNYFFEAKDQRNNSSRKQIEVKFKY